jgi:hypothetical protein
MFCEGSKMCCKDLTGRNLLLANPQNCVVAVFLTINSVKCNYYPQSSMKIVFLVLSFSITTLLCAQSNPKLDSVIVFFKENNIKMNTVTPPHGYTVYYNCDSLLFIRGDFGDTIKIWTPGMEWYVDLKEFSDIVKNEQYGTTQFVKHIDSDARIYVASYHKTEFIFRNDSLYEIGNSNPVTSEAFGNLLSSYLIKKEIDEATYKVRLDSLKQIEEREAVYTPKLIFAKKMFRKRKKVSLPKHLNFERDTIELESQWTQNGKKCYVVRINNKMESGEETTYAYAIDEDLKFIQWQGCAGK